MRKKRISKKNKKKTIEKAYKFFMDGKYCEGFSKVPRNTDIFTI